MKIKTSILCLSVGLLLPMMTVNCTEKKSAEVAKTEKTENVLDIALPVFDKFVEVTAEGVQLYKEPDEGSVTLVRWSEDCLEGERTDESTLYLWSDQPGKDGYEKETDIAFEGCAFAVLGEEGDFYKVIADKGADEAYLKKSCTKDIKSAPITIAMFDDPEFFDYARNHAMVKDGKYKGILLYESGGEASLTGTELHVGLLTDGVIAEPRNYYIDCREKPEQAEDVVIREENGNVFLDYNKNLVEEFSFNPKKLNEEQIAKVVETVKKKTPEVVRYIYYFPGRELSIIDFFYFPEK